MLLNSKGLFLSLEKENEKSLSSVHVQYIKREIRDVSCRVRTMTAKKCVKKCVMTHVQSCCFANLSLLLFFAVLAAVAVIVA